MRKDQIIFPLNFKGRTALFEGGADEAPRIEALAPEALGAPLEAALELANMKIAGKIELGSLCFAFVVFTDPAHPHLRYEQRDLLWRAFQVPIFEQFRAHDGCVIARECETHDGLHLVPQVGARVEEGELRIGDHATGLSGLLDTGHCECGDENPRLTVGGPLGKGWAREAAA